MAKDKAASGIDPQNAAAATANAVQNGIALSWVVSGYRLVPKQSEWTPKTGTYTRKRVGAVIVKTGDGLQFPAEAAVIFPKDGSPYLQVSGPTIRYEGPVLSPSDELSKKDREAIAHQITTFEANAAKQFVAWYRQQPNVPELTSRVASQTSATGVLLDQ